MKISFVLAFSLHQAVANEQGWGQALGLSRTSYSQQAAAWIASFDAQDVAESTGKTHAVKLRSQVSNLRHASASVADQSRSTRSAVADHRHVARGAAELIQFRGAANAANAEAAAARADANAERAKSARLKTELSNVARSQYSLRMRLKAVSTEARTHLAQLGKQLEVAKAAAQRSEMMLQVEIKAEAAKLKVAENSEIHLRNDLAVAKTSALTNSRAADAAAAKAVAKSEADRKAMSKLTAEMETTKKAAAKETANLRAQLRDLQQADAKAHHKLDEQLKATWKMVSLGKSRLESQLRETQKAREKAEDELEAEKLGEKLLLANLTRTQQKADLDAAGARKERMGFLVQVSQLQEQSATAQKSAAAAVQSAKVAKEEAEKQANEEILTAKHQNAEHQRHISALIQDTQAARANLTAATNAAALAHQRISALQATVSMKEEQLRAAVAESNELQAAREAATKGAATFQRMELTTEAALKETRQELSATKSDLQEMKSELASRVKEADSLSSKCKKLEAQLAAMIQTSSASQAKVKQEMHDTMLSAAAKVHELEDQNDRISTELQKAKKDLAVASQDSSKAKDTLMQETDAALRASQRADSLQTLLQQAQKDADSSGARAAQLAREVEALRQERAQVKQTITQTAEQQANLAAKAESLESARKTQLKRAKLAEAENKRLKAQVGELTGEEQRADELEEELAGLRQNMQHKNAEEAQMAKSLKMLRSLKDHYSSEYESSKHESDGWQSKVEGIQGDLTKTQQKLAAMTRSRDKALGRAKQAQSQEDEYFEENSRLEQQDEGLNAKLTEVSGAANRTQEENKMLAQKIEDLKADEAREKANSHAAWVANQGELIQARRDLSMSERVNENMQAELQRAQSVLSDKERQTLGLPPLNKTANVKAASPAVTNVKATSPPVTSASTANVAPAKAVPAASAAVHPATSQTMPAKTQATVAPVASAVAPTANAQTTTQAPLPGEPPKPVDDAAATLASVVDPKPAKPRSSLQKLAEFFASPLQR